MYASICEINRGTALRFNIDDVWIKETKEGIKISPEDPSDIEKISEMIECHHVDTIQVLVDLPNGLSSDLCILKSIKNKAIIKKIDVFVDVSSYERLYDFDQVESLRLSGPSKGLISLDVSKFPALEALNLNGNFKVEGLFSSNLRSLLVNESTKCIFTEKCPTLHRLSVAHSNFWGLRDMSEYFPNLQWIELIQHNMADLEGIEGLSDLEEVQICYCSKLKDISKIVHCQKIKNVYFEAIKKVSDYTPLTRLKNLKSLSLFKCGDVQSLSFLNDIPSLERFLFTCTNIVDGDLTPCLRLKSAWSSGGKRHYNIDVRDLP